MRTILLRGIVAAAVAGAGLTSCAAEKRGWEYAPIITSATYQHTQYNGKSQPVEVKAAKEDVSPFIITYFRSPEDEEYGLNGSADPPSEVGDYYVRVERPAGNGYRQGSPVKIEYHIQKAFITIAAESVQRFRYDGKPKEITAATEPPEDPSLVFSYFAEGNAAALAFPPAEKGVYRVAVVFPGNERYLGASRDIELRIE
jgi:hypothetical protein